MTRQTENSTFVGVYFQSNSNCFCFQIRSHLAEVDDAVIEQTDVINIVEGFEDDL